MEIWDKTLQKHLRNRFYATLKPLSIIQYALNCKKCSNGHSCEMKDVEML